MGVLGSASVICSDSTLTGSLKNFVLGITRNISGVEIDQIVTDTSTNYDVYIKFTANPYHALRIYNVLYDSSDDPEIKYSELQVDLYYKTATGEWALRGPLYGYDHNTMWYTNNSMLMLLCDGWSIVEGWPMLHIRAYRTDAAWESPICIFGALPFVDYFTKAQKPACCYVTGGNIDVSGKRTMVFETVDNGGGAQLVTSLVGGTVYPTNGSLTVASPVIHAVSGGSTYGYMVAPDWLYAIHQNGRLAYPGCGQTAVIGKAMFTSTWGGYYYYHDHSAKENDDNTNTGTDTGGDDAGTDTGTDEPTGDEETTEEGT